MKFIKGIYDFLVAWAEVVHEYRTQSNRHKYY